MPILPNARHERAVQEHIAGKSKVDAHEAAGYPRNDGNAAKVFAREDVKARIAELQGHVAQVVVAATGLDRAAVLTELAKLALAPIGDTNVMPSVKRAALVDYARIEGWVIDRKEVGKPGELDFIDKMSPDELREFIATGTAPARLRPSASADGGGNREAGSKPH